MLPSSLTLAPLLVSLAVAADPIEYEYNGTTNPKGEVVVTLKINEDISPTEVVVKGDGQTITKKTPALASGSTFQIKWTQRGAKADYELSLEGPEVRGTFNFPVLKGSATTAKGSLQPLSDRAEITERNKVRFKVGFQVDTYEYKVFDNDGFAIADQVVAAAIEPGGILEFDWRSGSEVFMIQVKAENAAGQNAEYKLVPWSVSIPHVDVNFDSGKAIIKPDEEWKVSEALAVALHELVAIDKVNQAVGASITPKLYIIGYTDTVGNAGKNQVLSQDRAKAIARYFYDKGFWAEIYYAGMGEQGLAVQTPDSTDEVRNRRATYLLRADQPPPGGEVPGRWAKLAPARGMPLGFQLPPLPEKYADYRNKGRTADKAEGLGSGAGGGGTGDDGGGEPGDESGRVDLARGPVDGAPTADAASPGGDAGGPPAIADAPGASAKGCSVAADGAPARHGWLFAFAAALVGVRRRRPRA